MWSQVQRGIGQMNQEDVVGLLGTPSCVLPYDPMTWYYISHCLERQVFFRAKPVSTVSRVVSFSKGGYLSSIKTITGGIEIPLATCSTPLPSSHGEEFLKQIFRNVGRFPPIRPTRL